MTGYITKDSGERAQYDSGMQRDTEAGKPRFDLIVPLDVPYAEQFLTRVAALMGRGAEKYDDRNWEKADSEAELARMKSSAFRHFMQWLCGETDEDHAAATVFNLLAHETIKHKAEQTCDAEMPEKYNPEPVRFGVSKDSISKENIERHPHVHTWEDCQETCIKNRYNNPSDCRMWGTMCDAVYCCTGGDQLYNH